MAHTLAIDYGSSFTTAAVALDGELLAFGDSQSSQFRLPSMVWVDEQGS